MGWPQSQDYNEAIQNAKTCFKDPELSKGAAVTNPLGMPLPCSGNFADVYQVHCPETKTRWAVKCFTRGDPKALEDRYAKIDQHLQQAKLPFAVGFRYLVEGIRVRKEWHPVLKMQWVEGFTLNHFVRDNLDKPNVLDALLQIWVRMGKRLREANMAHADLQHGNVLLVPGSTSASLAVKLIDYDGMWVPALAGKKSGEVGHPAYQHTKRLYEGTYSKEVDRFPLLVVATALRCLRVAGRPLWEKFDNGDNLLFREADLAAPERSPLFAELSKIQDTQAQKLVDTLLKATTEPLEDTPAVDQLLGEPAKKQVTVTKPAPAAPMAEAAFADLSDLKSPDTSAGQRRRRDEPAPSWQKWAMIGGGAAAALLAVVLVVSLATGRKQEPINADNNQTQRDPRQDATATRTTPPTPPALAPALAFAELPKLLIAPGKSERFTLKVNGVSNDPRLRTDLTELPAGVRKEQVGQDTRTGRSDWVLSVDDTAPPGEKEVTVVAAVGETSIRGTLQLTIAERAVVKVETPSATTLADRVLNPPPRALHSLALSADGRKVYGVNSLDLSVWDTSTGRATADIRDDRVGGGLVGHDGRALLFGKDRTLWLRQPGQANLQVVGTNHPALLRSALTPDGKRAVGLCGDLMRKPDGSLVTNESGLVYRNAALKVWDLELGKEVHSLALADGLPQALAISADGKRALTDGSSGTNAVRDMLVVWDLVAGRQARSGVARSHKDRFHSLALSADGKRAALGGNSSLVVWDLDADKQLLRVGPLAESVRALAFSADDRFLLSGGGPSDENQIRGASSLRLWDATSGAELLRKGGHTSLIFRVALTPDARWAVSTCNENTLRFWELKVENKPAPPAPSKETPPPAANKIATPTDKQRDDALANLKQVFADEYAKAKPTDRVARLALADLLAGKAREIKDNPTDRYVLLREAADLYQQLGNAAAALAALDALADEFDVERVALKEKALLEVAKLPPTQVPHKALAEAGLVVMEDARDAENFAALTRLADFAEAAATKSLDGPTRAKVIPAVKEARDLVKESTAALEAEVTLKTRPDDATANLVRGKFLCLRIGAWQRGLPLLAKGDDPKWKDLASKDASNPDSADDRTKLGDAWFELSRSTVVGKGEVLRRAAHWYNLALDAGLTALNKERVEKQLKLIEPQLPPSRAALVGGELRTIETHKGRVTDVAYLPDGRILSTGDEAFTRMWDANTGKETHTFRTPYARALSALSATPDGRWFATGANTGIVDCWEIGSRRISNSQQIGAGTVSIAFVSRKRQLVVGHSQGQVMLFDESGGNASVLLERSAAAVSAIAAAGAVAVLGTEQGVVQVISLQGTQTQKPLRLGGHKGRVLSVALTPDAVRAVSVGEDKAVRVWDVKQARVLRQLNGPGPVAKLALSADGRRLATCGEDGTVRVWDMTSYQEIRRFVGHKGKINAVTFAPDGRRLASAGDDGTIRIWGL